MVDLISDSEDGDKLEWDSDGDSEAWNLNAAGSSAQASRNLNAPGPSTMARMKQQGRQPCCFVLPRRPKSLVTISMEVDKAIGKSSRSGYPKS